MHNADYAVARCLSVNHTPVFYPSGSTYQTFFHHRVATSFYFLQDQTLWQYSDGNPHNRGVKCKGYE